MSLHQYFKLVPRKGLVFEAYVSRADVGSGLRLFMVTQVGSKWVHLFYAPRLQDIRMRRGEFASLYMQPACAPRFNADTYRENIKRIAYMMDRQGRVYSKTLVERVLSLPITCELSPTQYPRCT